MKCKLVIKDQANNGKFNVKIRIIYKRKVLYVKTNYYCFEKDFVAKSGKLKKPYPNYLFVNETLSEQILEIERKFNRLGNKVNEMDIKSLVSYLTNKHSGDPDFFDYCKEKIEYYSNSGRKSYAGSHNTVLNLLKLYTGNQVLHFSNFTYSFLKEFEQHLLKSGTKKNAIGVYMRNIRSLFNQAINEDLIEYNMYPFRKYKIPKEQIAKRNLNTPAIQAIKNIELTNNLEIVARDVFMLSFYLIGINMKDLYSLKEIHDGRIDFNRAKTGRPYSIKVYPEAQEIINRYMGNKRVLNFSDLYTDYRNLNKIINKKLKIIGEKAGINSPITTYYARHSWATIASSLNISKDIIQHALGHGLNTVTDLYVDFDLKKVDDANYNVIQSVNSK